MNEEDKQNSKDTDFVLMSAEIEDGLQRMVDIISFEKTDLETIAIIDSAMVSAHIAISDGELLLKKRETLKNAKKRANK